MTRHVRMFKPQFAPLVESGKKRQTVRPLPKRMPKAGDQISLRTWTDKPYRSKQRVLAAGDITSVELITIGTAITIDNKTLTKEQEEAFAIADGFTDAKALFAWFAAEHGLPFTGVLIKWDPYEPEPYQNGDDEEEPSCPDCGGDGLVEYNDAGPSAWGEDCPSEENHLVTCPNCRGSGLAKDCSSL